MSDDRYRGFTLLEALCAAAIMSMVMAGALSFYAVHSDGYARGQSGAAARQNARIALGSMARELRNAGYDLSGVRATLATPAAIQTAEDSLVSFVAEVTGDPVLDKVTYQTSGTTLRRSLASWSGGAFGAASTGDLASDVSALTFTYYNSAGAAIATPVASASLASITRVRISLSTSSSTMGEDQSFPLASDVQIRNVR